MASGKKRSSAHKLQKYKTYESSGRMITNKIKKLIRHLKKHTADAIASKTLQGLRK